MTKPLYARLDGVLYDVRVSEGQRVNIGDAMYIIEAAKSQLAVNAPYQGTVTRIVRKAGETVAANDLVLELEAEDASAS